MDISCGMEFQFPVSNGLADTAFGEAGSGIHDKLDLGTGQLLDSVSVSTSCSDHDTTDKHLTAADFKLDLGPADDLVSSSDFHLENSVSDITSESAVTEECSEGYSIINAALEGGGTVPKQTIPASCALNLGNVTNIQTFQLNQANLSSIQSMQVIPIENMQVLSSVRTLPSMERSHTVPPGALKVGSPGVLQSSTVLQSKIPSAVLQCKSSSALFQSNFAPAMLQPNSSPIVLQSKSPSTVLQTNSPSAVLLGNVLLLQTVPRQVCVSNNANIMSTLNSGLGHGQVLQILNTGSTSAPLSSSLPLTSQNILKVPQVTSLRQPPAPTQFYSPDATISSILKSRDKAAEPIKSNVPIVCQKTSVSRHSETVPCGNVMSLSPQSVTQQTKASDIPDATQKAVDAEADSQKNTKILVYGKNIALTFDCRNQKYVMNSIAKAMHSPNLENSVGKQSSSNTSSEQSTPVSVHAAVSPVESGQSTISTQCTDLKVNFQTPSSSVVQETDSTPRSVKYVSILGNTANEHVNLSSNNDVHNKHVNLPASNPSDKTKSSTLAENWTNGGSPNHTCTIHLNSMNTNQTSLSSENVQNKTVHVRKSKPTSPSSPERKKLKLKRCEQKKAIISLVKSPEEHEQLVMNADTSEEKGGDYVYQCDLCSATFNTQGNYNRHRMIHTINTKVRFNETILPLLPVLFYYIQL